ncbi:GNAT family N-acetyltransferase [Salimicrobium flavidum]|uniref:Protein N-acetyltransferase, RimJ/RimL family n=1 Tax=Salimicrobium flavidum TaxID=570947 RepID=A0A1N7JF33_9BACI|nr:GNAT family N-acetyltransferase [Salimicrobium flavidum]SIS47910.1 Protein N-acetyltransferase, RimJ/RimL family [Salimicrobium flavidum]
MEYRALDIDDAKQFLKFNKELDESGFMLYAPGERVMSENEQRQLIKKITEDSSTALIIGENEGEITGFIMLKGNELERIRHSAYLALGVKEEWRGHGVGKDLLRQGFKWARERGVSRLELTVLKNNRAALHLYKQMGFKIEGEKVNSLKIDGEYRNEYYMYKLLK